MGRFVNSGNSAFQVALNSEIYVDKTGLLAYTNKVMDTTAKFICNSRPRTFGKSITADMLTAYYCKGCSSKEMFSSLEIGQAPDFTKYLNQYDVIHLDIQWCMEPAGGPENVVSYITEKTILELRNYYPEILPDSIIWQAYRSMQTILPDHNLRYAVIPTAMKSPLHNLCSLTLLPILQESQSKYLCQKLHDGFSSFLSYRSY